MMLNPMSPKKISNNMQTLNNRNSIVWKWNSIKNHFVRKNNREFKIVQRIKRRNMMTLMKKAIKRIN